MLLNRLSNLLVPTLDMNFMAGGAADARIAWTGGANGTYWDSTGTLRLQRTNFNRNSTMVGAIAGVVSFGGSLPTGWNGTAAGTRTVSLPTVSGIACIDVNLTGVAGLTETFLATDSSTGIPALPGQVWTYSAYLQTVLDDAQVTGLVIEIIALDSVQAEIGRTSVDVFATRTQFLRRSVTMTMPALTASVYVRARYSYTGTPTLNYTLRLGAPQVERGFSATGFIATTNAAVSAVREDYDPTTLTALGVLNEEPRTNLYTFSADFGNAAWSKTTAVVTADQAVAPDGTTTADLLVANAATVGYTIQGLNHTAGTTYTHSLFIKPAGRTAFTLLAQANLFTDATTRSYTYTLTGAGSVAVGAGTGHSATIKQLQNGWYRLTLTYTPDVTISSGVQCRDNVNGDAVNGFYVWGAQLEAGTVATSYIPTAAATVTRTGECGVVSGGNVTGFASTVAGTIVAEYDCTSNGLLPTGGNAFPIIFELDSVAASIDSIQLLTSSGYGPGCTASVLIGGVGQAVMGKAHPMPSAAGTYNRMAIAYATNDFAACLNGGAMTLDAAGNVPAAFDRFTIGSQNGAVGGGLNCHIGHLRRIRYWPKRLPDAMLQALTT